MVGDWRNGVYHEIRHPKETLPPPSMVDQEEVREPNYLLLKEIEKELRAIKEKSREQHRKDGKHQKPIKTTEINAGLLLDEANHMWVEIGENRLNEGKRMKKRPAPPIPTSTQTQNYLNFNQLTFASNSFNNFENDSDNCPFTHKYDIKKNDNYYGRLDNDRESVKNEMKQDLKGLDLIDFAINSSDYGNYEDFNHNHDSKIKDVISNKNNIFTHLPTNYNDHSAKPNLRHEDSDFDIPALGKTKHQTSSDNNFMLKISENYKTSSSSSSSQLLEASSSSFTRLMQPPFKQFYSPNSTEEFCPQPPNSFNDQHPPNLPKNHQKTPSKHTNNATFNQNGVQKSQNRSTYSIDTVRVMPSDVKKIRKDIKTGFSSQYSFKDQEGKRKQLNKTESIINNNNNNNDNNDKNNRIDFNKNNNINNLLNDKNTNNAQNKTSQNSKQIVLNPSHFYPEKQQSHNALNHPSNHFSSHPLNQPYGRQAVQLTQPSHRISQYNLHNHKTTRAYQGNWDFSHNERGERIKRSIKNICNKEYEVTVMKMGVVMSIACLLFFVVGFVIAWFTKS